MDLKILGLVDEKILHVEKINIEEVSCYDFPSFCCYWYKYLIEFLVRQRAFNIIEKTKTILSFSQVRKVLIYLLADYFRLKYVCYKVLFKGV